MNIPLANRLIERRIGSFREKDAAHRIRFRHAFERSSSPQRDHRLSAGQRLHRRNPEIFSPWNEKCPAARKLLSPLFVAETPAEFDVPAGELAQSLELRAIAHNPQPPAVSSKNADR